MAPKGQRGGQGASLRGVVGPFRLQLQRGKVPSELHVEPRTPRRTQIVVFGLWGLGLSLGHFEQFRGHGREPTRNLGPKLHGDNGLPSGYLPPQFGVCPDLCTRDIPFGPTSAPTVAELS